MVKETTGTGSSQLEKLATPTATNSPQLYNASVDDAMFDDACDFGQFMLNPSWYLFVKIRGWLLDFHKQQKDMHAVSKEAKRSSFLHLQRPLYFCFVVGGWTTVFAKVYPLIRASHSLSDIHIYTGYAVAAMCVISWKVASSTCPGEITADSIWRFDTYHYDNLLYVKDCICPTLQLRKLARSKYDRYSGKHIPRFDHFCGWLGQPIGEENYREFLVFVAVHAAMCTYGSIVSGILILASNKGKGLIDNVFSDPILSIIFAFLTTASVPLIVFFAFHMYLIACGMTTNEYYKWKLISARHAEAQERFQQQHQTHHQLKGEGDVEGVAAGRQDGTTVADPGPHPCNQYDNGVFKNFMEVLRPRSLRRGREEMNKSD
jgi:DHHC palmitoyltransferase